MLSKFALVLVPLLWCSAQTELRQAVRTCDVPSVQRLIESGASVNEADARLDSPLHVAIRSGQPACVYLLLAAKANRYPPNRAGETPHLLARLYPAGVAHDQMGFLLEHLDSVRDGPNGKQQSLRFAISKGEASMVTLLLEVGADPNGVDAEGGTPLHQASLGGRVPIIQVLLAHSAKTEAFDKDGFLPLHLAALAGNAEAINALLASGAKLSARTRDSQESSLHIAAAWGRPGAVRALLAAGASNLDKDSKGRTPTDRAKENNFNEILLLLNPAKYL